MHLCGSRRQTGISLSPEALPVWTHRRAWDAGLALGGHDLLEQLLQRGPGQLRPLGNQLCVRLHVARA